VPVVRGREDDDLQPRVQAAELIEAREAVHSGHPEVEQRHIGSRALDEVEQRGPRRGRAHELDVLLGGERELYRFENECVVVGDDHTYAPHQAAPGSSEAGQS